MRRSRCSHVPINDKALSADALSDKTNKEDHLCRVEPTGSLDDTHMHNLMHMQLHTHTHTQVRLTMELA